MTWKDGAHGENSLYRSGDNGQPDGQAPARGGLPADGLEPHGVTCRAVPGRQHGISSGQAAATGEQIARAVAQVKLTFISPL